MALNAKRLPARRNLTGLWIVLATVGLFIYFLETTNYSLTLDAALAFSFQLACWAGALLVAVRRNSSRQMRVSDPLLLIMLWCFLYFVLPSILWLQGDTLLYGQYVTFDTWFTLQWLHGLFILGFLGGYLLMHPPVWVRPDLTQARLPSGWWLFALTLISLLMTVVTRVASGGGVLPGASYGQAWLGTQAAIQAAQAQGGAAYLSTQFSSKFWFYPILFQSIGLGLIISHWILKGRSWVLVLGFAGLIVLTNLLLGGGSRSSAIIVAIIAVILVDLLVRPIPFSVVAITMVVGLFVFDLLSVVRQAPFSQILPYLPIAVKQYFSPTYPRMEEFGIMLSKEAVMLQLVQAQDGSNYMHLLQNILYVLPSQVNPLKQNWIFTGDLLGSTMLGEAYYLGAGVAGSIVGDGLRIDGWFGVLLLAVILGLLMGAVQRWALGRRGLPHGTNLLRLCLWAGFLGWTFNFIRSDLGNLLTILFYYVFIPWLLVEFFRGRLTVKWLAPLSQRLEGMDPGKRKIGLHSPGKNIPSDLQPRKSNALRNDARE